MPFVARVEQTSTSQGAMSQDSETKDVGSGKIRTIEGQKVKNEVENELKRLAIGIDQSDSESLHCAPELKFGFF